MITLIVKLRKPWNIRWRSMFIDFLLGLVFLVLLTSFLIGINKYLKNNNFSVYFLFNISWISSISLYIMDLNNLPIISDFTKIYLAVFFLVTNVSYIIFRKISITEVRFVIDQNLNFERRLLNLFFYLWAVYFLYFLYSIYSTVGFQEFFLSNAARKIMYTLGKEYNINISYYIFGTFYLWGLSYFSTKYNEKNNVKYFIVLFSLLLTAAKMNFVLALIGSLLIKYHYRNLSYKQLLLRLIPYIGGFLVFLVLFSIFTGKVIDSSVGTIYSIEDMGRLTYNALLYPYTYIVSSLFALDYYINHTIIYHDIDYNFSYIFLPFYKILNKVGLNIDFPSHILPFVYIDSFETNVYSFFYELLHDLGFVGTLLFGIFSSFLYAIVDSNIQFNRTLSVYLFYANLAMASFLSIISFKFNTTMFIGYLFVFMFLIKGKIIAKKNI
jgi:oligosaccharide repeat unit polymerase